MVIPFSARWSLGVRSRKCCCHPAGSSWTLFPTIARKPRAERACPPSALSYRGQSPRTTGIPILGAFPGYLEKNQQLWQKLVNVCNVGQCQGLFRSSGQTIETGRRLGIRNPLGPTRTDGHVKTSSKSPGVPSFTYQVVKD